MLYLERTGIYDRKNIKTFDETDVTHVEHNFILNLLQKGINAILGNGTLAGATASMGQKSVQTEAKRLLSRGKLADAMDCILDFAEKTGNTQVRNAVLMLSGRLQYLSREQLKGTISTNDLMTERSQITNQLIHLVADLSF
ncbi:MAG: Effector-associated domain 11 [Bacteroidota bacterium]|jgi:hypothetical protein